MVTTPRQRTVGHGREGPEIGAADRNGSGPVPARGPGPRTGQVPDHVLLDRRAECAGYADRFLSPSLSTASGTNLGSAHDPKPIASAYYGLMKVPSLSVWLPPFSIASTSKGFSPEGRDATNSGDTVTLSVVAGTVTWNAPTMTW